MYPIGALRITPSNPKKMTLVNLGESQNRANRHRCGREIYGEGGRWIGMVGMWEVRAVNIQGMNL